MIDVDQSFDPEADSVRCPGTKMTLDEHREIEFAKIEQTPFYTPKTEDAPEEG